MFLFDYSGQKNIMVIIFFVDEGLLFKKKARVLTLILFQYGGFWWCWVMRIDILKKKEFWSFLAIWVFRGKTFGESAEKRLVHFPETPIHQKVRVPRNTPKLVFKNIFLKNFNPQSSWFRFFAWCVVLFLILLFERHFKATRLEL